MPSVSTSNITSIRYFFEELGFVQMLPTLIYMDNVPFMNSVVGDKGASVKSKHTMIRLSLMNEAFVNDVIDFKHMSTSHIPSDMLSKLVQAPTHQHLLTFINGQAPLITDSTISFSNATKVEPNANFL